MRTMVLLLVFPVRHMSANCLILDDSAFTNCLYTASKKVERVRGWGEGREGADLPAEPCMRQANTGR